MQRIWVYTRDQSSSCGSLALAALNKSVCFPVCKYVNVKNGTASVNARPWIKTQCDQTATNVEPPSPRPHPEPFKGHCSGAVKYARSMVLLADLSSSHSIGHEAWIRPAWWNLQLAFLGIQFVFREATLRLQFIVSTTAENFPPWQNGSALLAQQRNVPPISKPQIGDTVKS